MVPFVSVVFALGLPSFALWRGRRGGVLKHPYLFSVASFVFCAAGIIAEIFTIKRRLFAGDVGGIADTIDAVLIICIALLVFTVILNLLLLGITYTFKGESETVSAS